MEPVVKTADAQRRGDWMITYTGRRFWPLDPRAEDVDFRDVGHALSMICRYGGHIRRFYSVAEHSTIMADWFLRQEDAEHARWALLHDGSEAYLGDIIRPMKRSFPDVKTWEVAVDRAVFDAAGLEGLPPALIKDVDQRMVGLEAGELFRPETLAAADWMPAHEPLPGCCVIGWPPHVAERHFMQMFVRLFPGRLVA